MPMHKVEVDDEVFAFVQSHAEPLVDSFNSALRRILASGEAVASLRPVPGTREAKGDEGYRFSPGTPQALGQILAVVRLVHSGSCTRSEATRRVATKLGVTPQTVLDKYTRQLDLTAAQFDGLLAPERCEELQKLLLSRFPEYVDTVDAIFAAHLTLQKMVRAEHPLEIADRLFGPEHGVELAVPRRGAGPSRPPPDFTKLKRDG